MNPSIISLLAVTIGFTALVLWVYWPSNRTRIENFGSIPLLGDRDDEQVSQKENAQ